MTSLNFDIYLRSPERVWAVLTNPGKVPSERFGMSFHNDSDARHQVPGQTAEDETDSEAAAGRRLTCEWLQTDHLTANGGHPSVVSLEFTAMGQVTRLSLVHRYLTPDGSYLKVVAPGWPMLLSSLKSLVETGERWSSAPAPDPAAHSQPMQGDAQVLRATSRRPAPGKPCCGRPGQERR